MSVVLRVADDASPAARAGVAKRLLERGISVSYRRDVGERPEGVAAALAGSLAQLTSPAGAMTAMAVGSAGVTLLLMGAGKREELRTVSCETGSGG